MKVKAFKLASGEEFVAELLEIIPPVSDKSGKNRVYRVDNPICPSQQGLSPWFMFSEERTFDIPRSLMVFEPQDVIKSVLDIYVEQFGTIISPPSTILHS